MSHRHPVNQAIHDDTTRTQRAVDAFVGYFGSLKFIAWMTVFIILWVCLNVTGFIRHWDAYPFILLNLIFSTQASYAAPLILLSQNRAAERDRLKAEHDYGVNEQSLSEICATRDLAAKVHDLTVKQMDMLAELGYIGTELTALRKAVIDTTRTPKASPPRPVPPGAAPAVFKPKRRPSSP